MSFTVNWPNMQNSRGACLSLTATATVSLTNTAVTEHVSALLVSAHRYHWTSTLQHMLLNIKLQFV